MRYTVETELKNFPFWDGAKYTAKHLTEKEFDIIERAINEIYPDGDITDTDINNFVWFETELIAKYLGFETWAQFLESKDED